MTGWFPSSRRATCVGGSRWQNCFKLPCVHSSMTMRTSPSGASTHTPNSWITFWPGRIATQISTSCSGVASPTHRRQRRNTVPSDFSSMFHQRTSTTRELQDPMNCTQCRGNDLQRKQVERTRHQPRPSSSSPVKQGVAVHNNLLQGTQPPPPGKGVSWLLCGHCKVIPMLLESSAPRRSVFTATGAPRYVNASTTPKHPSPMVVLAACGGEPALRSGVPSATHQPFK